MLIKSISLAQVSQISASTKYENPSVNVIRSLLQHKHELTVYAKDMPYTLKAEEMELDLRTGRLVLEVEYAGSDVERYLIRGCLRFDLEALKGSLGIERETYSLRNVAVQLHKTDSTLYRLEFLLPESVYVHENRGAVRILFILGMARPRVHQKVGSWKRPATNLRGMSCSPSPPEPIAAPK